MKRRSFLKLSSTASIPLMINGVALTALSNTKLTSFINGDSDRVLVLVQLQGGNDGLNTLIPLEHYNNLAEVRSDIIVPENSLINFDNGLAWHPAMSEMNQLWSDASLAVVQSVAYPNQNRSHFRSTDIWNTASAADEFESTGWLGRYFNQEHPDYPQGLPNSDCPDPFAITVGNVVSESCQGALGNFSMALRDPFAPGSINIGEQDVVPDNCYGRELSYVREIAEQTNAYGEVIINAANLGNSLSSKYGEDNELAQKLKIVARLISGGLQTKVYVVQLGGFDTHANQVNTGSTTEGTHAQLLGSLSEAICAFQDDLVKLQIDKRVVGMTYSEFGRRIRANASLGTDHGTAAPLFLFGSCIQSQIFGENPIIDTNVGNQDGVPMQYDFRDVYGTVLMDWFELEESKVKELIYEDFQKLALFEFCESTSTSNPDALIDLSIFPNPAKERISLSFKGSGEVIKISLFDGLGAELKSIANTKFNAQNHTIKVDLNNLSPGSYFIRMKSKSSHKTMKFIKV